MSKRRKELEKARRIGHYDPLSSHEIDGVRKEKERLTAVTHIYFIISRLLLRFLLALRVKAKGIKKNKVLKRAVSFPSFSYTHQISFLSISLDVFFLAFPFISSSFFFLFLLSFYALRPAARANEENIACR